MAGREKVELPVLLSRNLRMTDLEKEQLKHKVVPKHIKFVDNNNNEVKYKILHEDIDKVKGKQPLITYH